MNGKYVRIAGTGSSAPDRVLTNADLEKMVDTTDEWITARTGINRILEEISGCGAAKAARIKPDAKNHAGGFWGGVHLGVRSCRMVI